MRHQKVKSMRTPSKSKKSEKLGKFLVRNANGTGRPDLSSLRKPIDTSVSDLRQVSGLLEDGTDEVKSILSYECNVIYECRVCHSLFRSIVNLVSHKREYCREKFDIALGRRVFNNYNMHFSRESVIHMFKTDQASNDGVKNDRILRSQVPKETNKKDLSAILELLSKRQEERMEKQNTDLENKNAKSNAPDDRHIYLEAIDTNCSAVYQTIKSSDTVDDTDLMKEQIAELQSMTDQNTLALEGQVSEKSDSPIQDTSDEENESLIYRLPINDLSCSICNAKFSTKKTLTVHMKTLHTSKRLCYPCPCCTNIFANTWSVYRHLYKVHKKTNEQVRKLRSQVQEKAFHRKITVMKDTENIRATEVSALKNVMENSDKTQEPISRAESNTKLCDSHRGRLRSRKASLSTYLQYCQTPIVACDDTTIRIKRCNESVSAFDDTPCKTKDVDLEADTIIDNIQRKTEDVDLGADTIIKSPDDKNISSENSDMSSSSSDHETSSHVQDVSLSLDKEDWDMLRNQHDCLSECNSVDNNNDLDVLSPQNIDNSEPPSPAENRDNFLLNENVESPGTICTDANEVSSAASEMRNEKEEASGHHSEKQLADWKERDVIEVEEDNTELQSSCSTPPNEKISLESKIATVANFQKLRCLKCRRKFTSIPNLRRHVAMHVGWNRYRCKLCDFKCFVKCECVAHCNKVHNMQNDRAAIAETVLEISQDEYTCNKDGITVVTGPTTESDNPDITDVAASSCRPETHVADSNDSKYTYATSLSEVTATDEWVAESRGSVERLSVDAVDSDDAVKTQNLTERVMNYRKLDDDPELKRMVMEVIFGSTDTGAIEQANSDKPGLETSDGASEDGTNANDNVCSTAITDESPKEGSCTILNRAKHQRPILNNAKLQRPTRNRVRPLSADFIYDLKEIAHRKESAFINDSEILHIRKKAKLYNY